LSIPQTFHRAFNCLPRNAFTCASTNIAKNGAFQATSFRREVGGDELAQMRHCGNAHALVNRSAFILENAEADLTPQMRSLINMFWDEWKLVEEQIKKLDLELERISAADAGCTRIRQIPGIGPVVAMAIVAAIGNGAAFHKGRDFAAWLGIVPRQYSTGGKAKLLGINKRGNV
jgi:transposase